MLKGRDAVYVFIRYALLLVLSLGNLYLFYAIFTPLTLYPVLFVLKIFYSNVSVSSSLIALEGLRISLVPACIAGAAYYLLLILNLTTPMNPKLRVKSLLFLFISFLILNIVRIVVFSILALNNFSYFDITHLIVWYAGSTIFIVLLWFANVGLFKIKAIPIYTDLKTIYKSTNSKSKSKNIKGKHRKKFRKL